MTAKDVQGTIEAIPAGQLRNGLLVLTNIDFGDDEGGGYRNGLMDLLMERLGSETPIVVELSNAGQTVEALDEGRARELYVILHERFGADKSAAVAEAEEPW